jgi:hypothetical protein
LTGINTLLNSEYKNSIKTFVCLGVEVEARNKITKQAQAKLKKQNKKAKTM